MGRAAKIMARCKRNPSDVKFTDLLWLCQQHFGDPRTAGSHYVFRTPWQGDPRVNLQVTGNGKAKWYQVKAVLKALSRLEGETDGEHS